MTIREAIASCKAALKEVTADSRLTSRFVFSNLQSTASLLVERQSNSLKLAMQQEVFQTLKCFPVIEAPEEDDCCGVRSKCIVYRTEFKLPPMFTDSEGPIIKDVFNVDYSKNYAVITAAAAVRMTKLNTRKYDKNIYVFHRDGYLYVTTRIKAINVVGLFKEDLSYADFGFCGNCKKDECKLYLDSTWFVPQSLQKPIIDETINKIAAIYKKIPEDININKNPNA